MPSTDSSASHCARISGDMCATAVSAMAAFQGDTGNEGPPLLWTRLVVVSELPIEPDTLLLRLLAGPGLGKDEPRQLATGRSSLNAPGDEYYGLRDAREGGRQGPDHGRTG